MVIRRSGGPYSDWLIIVCLGGDVLVCSHLMWLLVRAVCISGSVLVSLELDSNFNGDLVVCDGSFVGVWLASSVGASLIVIS